MSEIPPPFDALWFRLGFGFVIGACLGSFVTMLSYRLPRRWSLVTPGSSCPQCHTRLGVCDLVPLASWLWNRGVCRHCSTRIGARYPLIELVTAAACTGVFVVCGFTPWVFLALGVIVTIVTAFVMRLERQR